MATEEAPDRALEEVFGLVASDVRVDVLHALWDARTAGEKSVSFSTLRERTDVGDSGRFNYHLDRLVPTFVREREDGYALTYAGRQVIGAAVSGTYTGVEATTFGPVAVDECHDPACDGTIEARYDAGRVVFDCEACDRVPDVIAAPPILVGAHDPERDPGVLSDFLITVLWKLNRGFCPLCDGPVAATVSRLEPEREAVIEESVDVARECEECGAVRHTTAATALVGHPAVVSLLYDAGIDYREVPFWEQTWFTDATERVASEDPVRIEVGIGIDGETVTFTLDGDLDVVDHG